MSNDRRDPFSETDDFDNLGTGGEDSFGNEDQFGGIIGGDDDLDMPVDDTPPPAAGKPAKPSKPAKAPKAASNSAAPKAFIKTPIGICGIAFAVAMVSFIGFKAVTSAFPGSPEPEVAVVPALVAPASEPQIGNASGLMKPQASPEVVQAVQAPQHQVMPVVPDAPVAVPLPAPEVVQPASAKELEELKASIANLQEQASDIKELLRGVNRTLERQEAAQKALMDSVSVIKADLEKKAEQPAPVVLAPTTPAVTVNAGQAAAVRQAESSPRQRMTGLQVIETSQGGAMSIIKKASNGRVFTLFKGETINWAGVKSQVTSIEKDGELVLVGDKFFIDKVLEAPKAPVKAAAPIPAPERKSAPVREAKPVASRTAEGYTLNAVYNDKRSFGIVNNKGEFKSYKVGDTIDNLGVVKGLDEVGDLKVGNTVIKTVY
ncbi:hypothetical protein RBE51_19705 [Pseudomonas taiwanensis]|uniref:hypothetical protein n=1 Tax=Pseudomonas taiwanensis TaxID=470150 RepID=UPI0028DFAC56|nr:hypothetical protein [Pseudomonas taiwanensis]MDT8925018.1 hypothetical protein [Pseudomonas taiwanensis]